MSDGSSAALIRALLAQRGRGKTICPSEVARALAGTAGDWRARMDEVHAAADGLLKSGAIELSWQGRPMPERSGPYRIGVPS